MADGTVVKKLLESKLEGRRRMGRPRLRWLEDAEKDLWVMKVNPLNAELNPICHLLALLDAHHILHISRIRVKRS
jgi:hypothetical protein